MNCQSLVTAQTNGSDSLRTFNTNDFIVNIAAGLGGSGVIYGLQILKIKSKTNIGFGFTAQQNSVTPPNFPDDYIYESQWFGKPPRVKSKTNIFGLFAVKDFATNFAKIVFGLEAGASINTHQIYNFIPIRQSVGWLGHSSNYEIKKNMKLAPAALLKVTVNLPIDRRNYLQIAGYGNFNKHETLKGMMLGLSMPFENHRKKK